MDAWFTPEMGLAGLFASAFLSATLLPGGSEVVLFGVLKLHPQSLWPALWLATVGNTLGGMTSVLVGRLFPDKLTENRALAWARRHGAPILLLSWVPIIGDALCVAAGWLRLKWLPVMLFMAIGKFVRYLLVAISVTQLF
jgi:membrane protein YqaA with SNARE-associated domain